MTINLYAGTGYFLFSGISGIAHAALDAQLAILPHVPDANRVRFLANPADLPCGC